MQFLTISRLLAVGVASTLSISASLLSQSPVSANPDSQYRTQSKLIAQASCTDVAFVWPAQGELSGRFDESDYHMGIDIDAPVGTPIVAAADGEVVKVGWDGWGLGNAIKIRHNNGCYTVYGHNEENLVQVGQPVRQGERIALMGSTGFTDFSHLHFEVRLGEYDFIDPMIVLRNAPRTPAATPPRTSSNNSTYQPTALNNPSTATAACAGETLISEETAAFRIQIYQNNGQLSYQGQNKQNGATICLPAQVTSRGRYQAQNGSYSYVVDADGYQVLRYGRPIREERFF
ncbi:MAG: M23 family metallopeptidase [Spirulinaceae cyanobacterium]